MHLQTIFLLIKTLERCQDFPSNKNIIIQINFDTCLIRIDIVISVLMNSNQIKSSNLLAVGTLLEQYYRTQILDQI
jgi:hypothetical protein